LFCYEKPNENKQLNKNNYLSLDCGLDNLLTSYDVNNKSSFIIDGKPLKSVNHYYNKQKAKLQSEYERNKLKDKNTKRFIKLSEYRKNYINNYFNQTVNRIVKYCINNNIGTIVIGDFKGIKQEINLGKKNNQNFVENALSKISIVKDGTHSSPTYVNDGYPLITSKNLMKNGKIEFKDLNYITNHDFDEINKRSKVDKGDILFGMIGTLGNPVICENDNFAIKNVALIKAKPPLNSYLIHYLKSKLVLDQFDFLKTGGTQKFIALNKIRELKILLPNLEAQKKIGTFLNKIEELKVKEEKVLNIYNLFKKYYLSEIFSKGE
jgi:IS605 OrfB family transposase